MITNHLFVTFFFFLPNIGIQIHKLYLKDNDHSQLSIFNIIPIKSL